MATTTYLSNPAVLTVGGADLRDQASAISFTLGYTPLTSTAFGDDGERSVKGLQTVEGTLTLYVSYGATEVEGVIAGEIGEGDTTIVIKKASGAIAADNPEWTISNTMIGNYSLNYVTNELQVMEVSFSGGTWVRDVTP
jgi:hypothetical protein